MTSERKLDTLINLAFECFLKGSKPYHVVPGVGGEFEIVDDENNSTSKTYGKAHSFFTRKLERMNKTATPA